MAKYDLRQKALDLRKVGQSYTQIKQALGVSKSTLSLWLRGHPLSKERIRLLRDVSEVRIEKFRQTMSAKREQRFADACDVEKANLIPLSDRELYIAGLFLYWGEGLKDLRYSIALYNTNPQMIKFALYWYTKTLLIPRQKIKIKLHLYRDMDVEDQQRFWSKALSLPISQFANPYIKAVSKTGLNHKGGFGHGTCSLVVHDVLLKEKIMAGIKAVADYYG
jgi:hypothetical protein